VALREIATGKINYDLINRVNAEDVEREEEFPVEESQEPI